MGQLTMIVAGYSSLHGAASLSYKALYFPTASYKRFFAATFSHCAAISVTSSAAVIVFVGTSGISVLQIHKFPVAADKVAFCKASRQRNILRIRFSIYPNISKIEYHPISSHLDKL